MVAQSNVRETALVIPIDERVVVAIAPTLDPLGHHLSSLA